MLTKKYLDVDVVTAAKERIKSIFDNGVKVRLSISGGKDSIVLSDIIYKMCLSGEIDKNRLEIVYVDEEAMYDDVTDIVKEWRMKFKSIGVEFKWYCIEVKHFNCLNSLKDEETFICWDRHKKDKWVRPMPKFAITSHPLLIPRKDNYQSFFNRLSKNDGSITMIGIRASESVQRLINIANMKNGITGGKAYPIYDMLDKDVWLYIKRNHLKIPKTYENLYRVGVSANRLRISQFFSIDTVSSLVSLSELYPGLMERITRREPNAYIALMYWDSEMFGRSTKTRRNAEKSQEEQKDYRKLLMNLFKNRESLDNENKKLLLDKSKMLVVRFGMKMSQKEYKKLYEMVKAGDPKQRTYRAVFSAIHQKYAQETTKKHKGGKYE